MTRRSLYRLALFLDDDATDVATIGYVYARGDDEAMDLLYRIVGRAVTAKEEAFHRFQILGRPYDLASCDDAFFTCEEVEGVERLVELYDSEA